MYIQSFVHGPLQCITSNEETILQDFQDILRYNYLTCSILQALNNVLPVAKGLKVFYLTYILVYFG